MPMAPNFPPPPPASPMASGSCWRQSPCTPADWALACWPRSASHSRRFVSLVVPSLSADSASGWLDRLKSLPEIEQALRRLPPQERLEDLREGVLTNAESKGSG